MENNKYSQKLSRLWTFMLACLFLAGCQSISGPSGLYNEGIPGTARWAVLPFVNHTDARADIAVQVERIMMVQLPSAGVVEPRLYPESQVTTASDSLADAHRLQNGKQWAAQTDMSFAMTGEITEWNIDEEGRAFVSMNLEVSDVRTNKQLWSVSGRGEGRPGDDFYAVSRQLVTNLLTSLPINRMK